MKCNCVITSEIRFAAIPKSKAHIEYGSQNGHKSAERFMRHSFSFIIRREGINNDLERFNRDIQSGHYTSSNSEIYPGTIRRSRYGREKEVSFGKLAQVTENVIKQLA
jgi:hypothetical protein